VSYDGTNFYAYDGEGRLCAVQPTSGSTAFGYIYDADGNRVAKGTITASLNPLTTPLSCDPTSNGFTLTESYVLGPGGEELSMLDGANHWQRTNVYAAGKLVGAYDLVAGQPALHFQIADPLGSRRLQTDSIGWPEEQFTNWPFGDELIPSTAPNAPPSGGDDATPLHFTGKERDAESGNDYFGARYYSSTMGRFLSPDPILYNDLRLLNPQRWNKYAYVINNPLVLTDPTGKDAIAVNLVGEVPVGGHEGIIVVNHDGSATYARFGPQHASSASDAGKVTIVDLKPVAFNSSGLPTDDAYKQLASEVGQIEGQPTSTVGFNYFKTSDSETAALEQWIQGWKARQAPHYDVNGINCAAFCIAGLIKGGAIGTGPLGRVVLIPNRLFDILSHLADENWTWQGRQANPEGDVQRHKTVPCLKNRDGSCAD
jgi:RHS repeat-associated protein